LNLQDFGLVVIYLKTNLVKIGSDVFMVASVFQFIVEKKSCSPYFFS